MAVAQLPRTLEVTRTALADPAALRKEWEELQLRSDSSVFLSWLWIGCWLEVYRPRVDVIRVMSGSDLVGLALLVPVVERRHGVIRSRCLRLHQTGIPEQDQIWIEYNGFLACSGMEQQVGEAIFHYLGQQPNWDEFVAGGVSSAMARGFARISGLASHIRWQAPCYGVDLQLVRSSGKSYLDGLSANTRHQIRRSSRLYREQGELGLYRPGNPDEAVAMFDEMAPGHIARWGKGPYGSGFNNPWFVRFHRALIRQNWADGGVELMQLRAGERVLASFYNLCYRNTVYFYLGVTVAETDNRLKPGLLGHSLCIEDYLARGFSFYDFMGGQERYKESLGKQHSQLVQISLQRPRMNLALERALRALRHGFVSRTRSADGY